MKNSKTIFTIFLVTIAIALFFFFKNNGKNHSETNIKIPENISLRYHFEVEEVLESEENAKLFKLKSSRLGKSSISGVVSFSKVEDFFFKISLEDMTICEIEVLDKNLCVAKDELKTKSAFVKFSKEGTPISVLFSPEETPLLKKIIKSIFSSFRYEKVQTPTIRTETLTDLLFDFQYEMKDQILSKKSVNVTPLFSYLPKDSMGITSGEALYVFNSKIYPETIKGEFVSTFLSQQKPILHSRTHFSFKLIATLPHTRQDEKVLTLFVEEHLELSNTQLGQEERILKAQLGTFTMSQLINEVKQALKTGKYESISDWIINASALLKLNPQLAYELGTLLNAEGNIQGRDLIFDVLAAANTKEAQDVLMGHLKAIGAQHEEFPRLLKRTFSLSNPSEKFNSFLKDIVEKTEDLKTFESTALILGSQAASYARLGNNDLAHKTLELISEKMHQHDDSFLEFGIRALGNAAHPDFENEILRYGDSPNERLRLATALALRRYTSDSAKEELLRLCADKAEAVQDEAIASLRRKPLNPSDQNFLVSNFKNYSSSTMGEVMNILESSNTLNVNTLALLVQTMKETELPRDIQDRIQRFAERFK